MTPSKVVWPPERAAEIKATKEKLRVAERQRALGVSPRMAWKWNPGYDSWQVDPEDE